MFFVVQTHLRYRAVFVQLTCPNPTSRTGAIEPVDDRTEVAAVDVLPRFGWFQKHEGGIGEVKPARSPRLGTVGPACLGRDATGDLAAFARAIDSAEQRIGPAVELPNRAGETPVDRPPLRSRRAG